MQGYERKRGEMQGRERENEKCEKAREKRCQGEREEMLGREREREM